MGVNRENDSAKAKRFAEIYVYEHPGNITQSFFQLCEEYPSHASMTGKPSLTYSTKQTYGYRYFQRKAVQNAIQKERAKAQVAYDIRKNEIVASLKGIAFDESNKVKDRLTALKQLSDLAGLNTQNVKLDAKHDIEVVVE